ncbi:M56 family metallopeptidase [uncultured Psychroserpens sp.]|uniref:M56 family metallopeptidase n=1 Tax=uncultured Psychroserpens sp. TaxID=255436 RepID=UPI002636895F|nr:M56 family metallopeptidase [uncultured Psychroserpens sp.]
MAVYLLKFSVCLAILMVFYKLFLENTSIHKFKRFYLLGALLIAFLIPSLTFIEYIEPVATDIGFLEPIANVDLKEDTSQVSSIHYTSIILWSLYGLGVIVFLFKFCYNLYQIVSRIKNNPKYKSDSFINVLVSHLKVPHTFFSYIFLNRHKFENNDIPREVLLHEQTHAKQKHSIDILLLELLQIVFWFNPLIYLLRKEIKLNHEFLADQAVLEMGIQPSAYQNIILAFSSKASDQQLANAINYSSIKKRFTVMKTKTSKQSIWVKSLLILPILAILFYSFTERKQVVKKNTDTSSLLNRTSEGVSEALMKEYNDFIIDFITTQKLNFSKYERCVTIYNLMSDEQKASVEPYPKIPGIDLSKTKAIIPSVNQFESWKNENEYAIWLDGVKIPNAKLNSYSVDDIAHYVNSFVHKNARNEDFPQPNQLSLYTKEGFKTSYQESKINEYKAATKTYSEAIQRYIKGEQMNHSELLILKDRSLRLYESFSKEELKKHKLKPPPPPPAKKVYQEGASKAQVVAYNSWAKAINQKMAKAKANSDVNEYPIIKVKEVKKYKAIYSIMTETQKKASEPWPSFPPPPPPPPPPIHKGKVSESLIKTYNNWVKGLKNSDGTYNRITSDNYKYYISIYHAMTDEQKKNSAGIPPPPPPPIPGNLAPEGKKKTQASREQSLKTHYDKVLKANSNTGTSNLPPPPPPPKSPLDHIIDMAKKDAKFFYNDKEITSDKAISIVKRKGGLVDISTQSMNNKRPLVYITEKGHLVGVKGTDELVVMINGKTPVNGQLSLPRNEFNNLNLTMDKLKIQSFKFKVPGKRTVSISGNSLNDTSKSYVKDIPEGSSVQFFDIKSTNGLKLPPVVVSIKK